MLLIVKCRFGRGAWRVEKYGFRVEAAAIADRG
jgi:hypothetical protein